MAPSFVSLDIAESATNASPKSLVLTNGESSMTSIRYLS